MTSPFFIFLEEKGDRWFGEIMTSSFFILLEEKGDRMGIKKPSELESELLIYVLQILCIIDLKPICSMCMMYLCFK